MATHTAVAPEVDDLDGSALRAAVGGNVEAGLIAARDRYALAYQWCITHPPVEPGEAAVFGDSGLPGLEDCDLRVGGAGTPGVAVFAAEEYAATAGVTPLAGLRGLSDTLDHTTGVGGTSKLGAVGDSVDLTKFHDLVCDEATALVEEVAPRPSRNPDARDG